MAVLLGSHSYLVPASSGRFLITMAVPIFDPGRSPGMKWYTKEEEREEKRKRKGREEKEEGEPEY